MHKLAVKFSRAASVFPEGDDLCIAIRRELILNLEFACKLTLHSQICTAREVLRLDDVSVSRNRATNPPLSTLNNNYSPDDACLWAVGKGVFPAVSRWFWRDSAGGDAMLQKHAEQTSGENLPTSVLLMSADSFRSHGKGRSLLRGIWWYRTGDDEKFNCN